MQEVLLRIIEKLEERKQSHERMIAYESKNGTVTEEFQARKAVEVVEDAIEIVKQEAEKYNNGWIPCSERLPEEMELVLIYAESTARGGSIRVVAQLYNGFWFAQTSSETLGLTGIGQYNVIAWQQLPHPYQLKGE